MGWVFGAGFEVPAASPLAVLPSVARLAGGAAVPAASQALTGPGKPAGTEQGESTSPPWHPCPAPPAQCGHPLVLREREGTGAGLAVLGGPGGGVPVEAGGTLVTEVPCRVVRASLGDSGGTNWGCQGWANATAPPKTLGMWGLTEQAPLSGWQLSEWPLHSHSSQCPRYSPPPVRVYPGAQSCGRDSVGTPTAWARGWAGLRRGLGGQRGDAGAGG